MFTAYTQSGKVPNGSPSPPPQHAAGHGASQTGLPPPGVTPAPADSIAPSSTAFSPLARGFYYYVDTVYIILYRIAVLGTLPCSPARQVKFSGVLSDVFVE